MLNLCLRRTRFPKREWLLWVMVASACALILANRTDAAEAKLAATTWSAFVETNFPFFSSVLDARNLGKDWPTNNLTPRGLILNLGNQCWACFDT